jgi:hypothetical protein
MLVPDGYLHQTPRRLTNSWVSDEPPQARRIGHLAEENFGLLVEAGSNRPFHSWVVRASATAEHLPSTPIPTTQRRFAEHMLSAAELESKMAVEAPDHEPMRAVISVNGVNVSVR